MRKFKMPKSIELRFNKEEDSQNFYLTHIEGATSTSFPNYLRVEENQYKGAVKTKEILRGKKGKWDENILTGLGTTKHPKIFFGDYFKKGKKEFLIIHFSNDGNILKIKYFKGFYPYNPTLRQGIINNYIKFN